MANVKIIFVCNSTREKFHPKNYLFFSIKHDKVSFIFQMFEKKSFLSIYQIATSNVVSQVAANLYYYFWMISVELISKSTQEKLYEMNPHFNFYELKHI